MPFATNGINKLIEQSILRADKMGVKVISLAALNKVCHIIDFFFFNSKTDQNIYNHGKRIRVQGTDKKHERRSKTLKNQLNNRSEKNHATNNLD